MSFDARAVRAEFPVFEHRPEGFHYLDSAATGQICRAAAEALLAFETENRANVKRGIYPLAEAAILHHRLQLLVELDRALGRARPPGVVRRPLVGAHQDVTLGLGHAHSPREISIVGWMTSGGIP